MALARKCDICGKFHDFYNVKKNYENPNGFFLVNTNEDDDYFPAPRTDCCPDCMKSLMEHIEYLRNKPEEQK